MQVVGLAVGAFSTGLDLWLGIGRVANQINCYLHIYGRIGILIPFLANSEVFQLVEEVLYNFDDAIAQNFLQYQLQQISMVAMTGSVVAGVATSGLSFKYLSGAHWTAKFFILASLLSGTFCVYYAMKQLRILGALVTPRDIRNWLRAPPEKVRCKNKNRPSVKAVLILDTPRALVTMAAISYIVGLSIYLTCVYLRNLDTDTNSSYNRNIMITYFVTLWLCLALYTKADLFDHYNDRNRTGLAVVMMLVSLKKLFTGIEETECERGFPGHVEGKAPCPPRSLKNRSPIYQPQDAEAAVNTQRKVSVQNGPTMVEGSRAIEPVKKDAMKHVAKPPDTITAALTKSINSRKACLDADRELLSALMGFKDSITHFP